MKIRNIFSIIMVLVMLFLSQAVCTESAPAAQAKASKSSSVAATPSSGEWDTLVKRAQQEGKVVIYNSGIGDTAGQLTKAFHDRYGINLDFLTGRGGEIIQKILTERSAGLYVPDIATSGVTPYVTIIAPANIVLPLEPLIIIDEVRDATKWRLGRIPFLDKKKQLVPLASTRQSKYVCINTTLVKPNEITSYNDLLNPKWKGKIVMNDPTVVGHGNSWISFMMIRLYGREKGTEYMKKLLLNQPMIQRDERLQLEWVAKGKYPVLIAAKPTLVESFVKLGAPLDWANLKEPGSTSSGSLNLYAMQNAPHPNAQKLFVNWVLGREAGEIIATSSGYPSERLDVSTAGYEPSELPGPADAREDEDYVLQKSDVLKLAGIIFKDLVSK